MAQRFLLKAYYDKTKKDPFGLTERKDFYVFYCSSIRDLGATFRCITPKGFGIPTPATLSSRTKTYLSYNPPGGIIELRHPWFDTPMYEYKRFTGAAPKFKELEFTNGFNFTHKLKITDTKF